MEPLVFKRWSNKKWAVLASFHKLIIIATLCYSYILLGQEPYSTTEDSTGSARRVDLEEVEALADLPASLEGIGLKPLVLITSQDIKSAPASSVEEVLDYLPQIDIRQRGRMGTQADLSIQGGTFDQSMVLLNGINISDPQTGHFQLNLPVDISAISRIEIATGSAARRFGTNAFSGVVEFVTIPEDSTWLRSGIRYGQHKYYKAFLVTNLKGKNISTLANVSTSGSSGYKKNTDFRSTHAYIHSTAERKLFTAHMILGMNSKRFGANAYYTPRFEEQYEETSTGFFALKLENLLPQIKWSFNNYLKLSQDHFLLERQNPQFYQNDHMTKILGSDLEGKMSWRAGVSHIGLHFRNEIINSTSLGLALDEPKNNPYREDVTFTFGEKRQTVNLNLNHTLEQGPLSVSGGFLFHMNSSRDFRPGFYPGLDLRVKFPGNIRVYTSINQSMRLPTFTDLYYQGPSNVGNQFLSPETATTIELGIWKKEASLSAGLNGFYRRGRDMIDWIWMEDLKWHTKNLSQIDAAGGDFTFMYHFNKRKGTAIKIERINFSYAFTHLVKVSDQVISRYVLDNLRHKLLLAPDLTLMKNFSLSLRLSYQDRNGSYLKYDGATGETMEQPFDPFFLFDSKLSFQLKRLHIFIEASNLFNIQYNDIGNVIQPGRWFIAGIEIN